MLHNIDIAVVSECLCHLRAQYPIQSPGICIGQQNLRIDHPISRLEWLALFSLKRHTNSFVAVEKNPMRHEQAHSRLPENQTGTLRISENTTFTNDGVMNYVIGGLQ